MPECSHQLRSSASLETQGRQAPRRALTLLEVVVSTLIVGVMTVAALNTLGAVTRSSQSFGDRAVALGLAEDLMAEILQASYKDPDEDPTFGRETSESAGPRNQFDDVDDYDGWNKQPPQDADGTSLPDRDDWRRTVTVEHVAVDNTAQIMADNIDTGVKRIHVIVQLQDQTLVELIAVRTDTD